MENNIWETYLSRVSETMGDYGDDTIDVFALNLGTSTHRLIDTIKSEMKFKQDFKAEKIKNLGDILYACACLQIYYQLPSNRYANMFIYDIQLQGEGVLEVDYMEMYANLLADLVELTEAILENDIDYVAFVVSKITCFVFDICAISSITPIKCLGISVTENKVVNTPAAETPVEKYNKQFLLSKQDAKQNKSIEVLIDIIQHKSNPLYQGLKIKYGNKTKSFKSKFIIKDFFELSNFVALELKESSYRLNYTPKLREVFDKLKDKIFMGYLSGEALYSVKEVINKEHKDLPAGRTVFIDRRRYRPVLMDNNMKTLTDLLDYINTLPKK